ncbi:ras gtpase-related [Anaeramoeba flamelloides]|uniref:Ras gtpase-related n=1 Tax=Anaeramoeba flamelloides TaxID=1746091 RepID=A0AAV7Z1D0_9EUKA|nr:ras gtpase-related [Anaeramoeba flamelloides]KAJ6230439.1 ras gtpase-related [Anaeramoeba flamelloides]
MEERRIVILGGGGVGKSAMTIRFLQNFFVTEYDPTIEENYRKQILVDNKPVFLDVLDTAGQEDYTSLREQYMETGQGFIIVYSITEKGSFEEVPEIYKTVLRVKDAETFPTVICGNKGDLECRREVTFMEGSNLAKTYGVPFYETSAKTLKNLEMAFHQIIREIRKVELPKKKRKKCNIL